MTNEAKTTTNSTVLDKLERRKLRCDRCRPHRCENATRRPKTDRGKNHPPSGKIISLTRC